MHAVCVCVSAGVCARELFLFVKFVLKHYFQTFKKIIFHKGACIKRKSFS